MGIIFCLMGKSSTGKDTIFRLLKADKDLNLFPIITYTTRPIRNNEQNGIDYHFISQEQLDQFKNDRKIIEIRKYDTIDGEWVYCTIADGNINTLSKNHIIITTLQSYESLREYFGNETVFPVYIEVPDLIRLERAIEREKQQLRPNYDELCRRFLADNIDFSIEKLQSIGVVKKYNNTNLDRCFNQIKEDLISII